MKTIKQKLSFSIMMLLPFMAFAQTITTIAGNGYGAGAGSGGYSGNSVSATTAEMSLPAGIVFDANGNLYIADLLNNIIRKVSSTGIITTFAGTGSGGYTGDNGLATSAELNWPSGLVLDASGNLYISDAFNNVIRKVNTLGVITTIVGNGYGAGLGEGSGGYTGDNGLATSAELNGPSGIAFDKQGNLYIADQVNNVIRKVNSAGIITTIAGTGNPAYTGDNGLANIATLNSPQGLTFDANGNLYIADFGNNVIRKINSAGVISTFAGNGYKAGTNSGGYTGDNGPATSAELTLPTGVTFDGDGNLYIADFFNNVIRKVNTSGIISTIAGDGYEAGHSSGVTGGYTGDNGPATSAELNWPFGVAFNHGSLYFSDQNNNVVRKVTTNITGTEELTTNSGDALLYPNPASNMVCLQFKTTQEKSTIEVYDLQGKQVFIEQNCKGELISFSAANFNSGIYFVRVTGSDGYISTNKLSVLH